MKYGEIYASGLLESIKAVTISLAISFDRAEVEANDATIETLEHILEQINALRDRIDR